MSGALRALRRQVLQPQVIVRWAVGLAIIALIIWSLSIQEIVRAFAGVAWAFVLLNFAIKIVLRVLAGVKWHLIVRLQDPGAALKHSLAAHFAGTAVGAVAPLVGSDLPVIYAYYRQSRQAVTAVSTVFVDRLIGLYLLIAIGAVAVLLNLERLLALSGLLWIVIATVALALAGPFVALWLFKRRPPFLLKLLPRKLKGLLLEVADQLAEYWAWGRPMLLANAALSLLVQLLRVLSVWTLALAVGAPGDLIDYAVVAPLMFFIMVLPIPAASIGLEQGVFVVVLGMIGVPGAMAFAMAVLNRLLTILSVLPGIACISLGWGLGPRENVRLAAGSK